MSKGLKESIESEIIKVLFKCCDMDACGHLTVKVTEEEFAEAILTLIEQEKVKARIDEQENQVVFCDNKEIRRAYGINALYLGTRYNETREARIEELQSQLNESEKK